MVKGNNLLEEIKSTIVHTDKIVMGLFNSVAKCTLKNLFFDSQCWYNRKDIIRLLIIVGSCGIIAEEQHFNNFSFDLFVIKNPFKHSAI